MMKRLFAIAPAIVLILSMVLALSAQKAHAAFNANNLIDDHIFNNAGSMGPAQIDAWLNSNFGSASCISTAHGFSAPDPTGYSPGGGFTYSGNVSAGQVISDAAQTYGINPEVLLVTLQKEQSLVSGGSGCTVLGDTGAMGYGCPDSGTTHNYPAEGALAAPLFYLNNSPITAVNGTCVNTASKAGFSQQVIHGAWLLKFGQQRSLGNTAWNVQLNNLPQNGDHWDNSDDPQTCYSGPMTQGTFKRCSTDDNAVFYDGYVTIDGSNVHMNSGATAALYWYTPHFHGNQNFYNLFSQWFGNPNTPCLATSNLSSTPSGSQVISYQYGDGLTNLAFTQMNSTGSACAEVHLWNPGYQSWLTHIATGMKASNPAGGALIAMKPPGSSHSGLVYITYSGVGSVVEVHRFSPDFQTFPGFYDVPTNLGGVINASTGTFVAGDFLGQGYDQIAYVLYSGSGGMAEVHLFDRSLTKAIGFYDVPTNLGNVSATSGTFVAGDFLGRGYDQLAYVLYRGNNGNAEVHLFDRSLTKAIGFYDVPTNLGNVSATSGTFVVGNLLSRGDQLAYILYGGGGGRVEVHTFNPSLTQAIGYQDIATNLPGFDPTQ